MKRKWIIGFLLVFCFLTSSVSYAAQKDDAFWCYYQPYWSWGEREWDTPWESVRELASDDICRPLAEETTYTVPEGKEETYTLSYKLNGGKIVGEKVKTYQVFDKETKLPEAKRKGYIFMGWLFGHENRVDYRTWFSLYNGDGSIRGNQTLTADWKKIRVKRQGQKGIRISLYNRESYDNRGVACLYSAKKNMKDAKIICLNEKFSDKKTKGIIRGRKTKNYTSKYYPKKKLLTVDLKNLKKGKTYYLQFRRINELVSGYFYMNVKVLKTVKVK